MSLEPLLAQTELTLSCSCPPLSIAMDRELFKSLLYNLLDNARKASPTGGRLSFTAQAEGETLRREAESRLDAAADLIVGRVVKD